MTREEWIAHYGVAEGNAKPGPDAYMTGLSDEEEEKKKEKMKKQAEMDDDDPDAYKELPGDKEAREEGKVKKSKHVTAYHRLYGEDLDESTMSDIHQMAGEAKSKEDFLKMFFKEYGAKVKKTKDSEEWAASLYDDMNESKITEKSVYFYQDKVETLVKDLDAEEYEVFAFDNDVDPDDANMMSDFIGSLSKKDAKAIIKQLVGENLDEKKIWVPDFESKGYQEAEAQINDWRRKLYRKLDDRDFDQFRNTMIDHFGLEVPDYLRESEEHDSMAYGQLERIIEYATMLRDRYDQGYTFDAWMHSLITKSKSYLNSVFDALDGDDGQIEETQQMTKKEWKKIKKFNKHVTDSGEKFVMNYNDMIGTFLEPVEIIDEAKDNLYLQLHKKYADQVKGLKAKKIKKLTDLVSVQRWSMEDREDYFDMDSKKKKELTAEYEEERKLFKKYVGGDDSVMLPKGTESLREDVNERAAMGFDAMTGLYYFDGVPFTQDRLDQVIGWLKGTTIKAGKSLPKQFTYKPAIQIEDEVGGEQVTFDTDKIKFLEYIRKEMKGKLASDADFNESNELSEAKFPGRKGDFIKWKDQYFDIKKTAGSTAYVKFPHTASHAFSQVWDDEVTLADEKHRGKKVWLMESNQLNEEKAEGDRGPIDNPDIETALKKKADDTGVPIGLIRIVMRRGMAAWKTGHRPGAGQEQWGYARVNSFLTKQPGTWGDADSDVAKEVRDGGHDSKLKKA